ncbi:MAG: arylesterase [Proteobacteria bacterium]|nr:arylesterase [Pseudomonadota bacterium]MBU1688928.1 arylesterase [Pseudomonadota bacterium]
MKKILIVGLVILLGGGFFLFNPHPQIKNADTAAGPIVCFGDSLTAGVGAVSDQDYPAQLSRLLGVEVINAGISGETTAQGLARVDTVLAFRPGIAIVILGGNDLRKGVSRDSAFRNLRRIVELLQEAGALVVLGGIDIPLFSKGYDAGYRELAQSSGSVLIPNVFAGIWGRVELMSDQIHPNSLGYGVMAGMVAEAVRPFLEVTSRPRIISDH